MKALIIAACMMSDLHPASNIVLDDFLNEKTSVAQFLRDFSLPSSDMLRYTKCVVQESAQLRSTRDFAVR